MERKGKGRKGKERKGKERKGKETLSSPGGWRIEMQTCPDFSLMLGCHISETKRIWEQKSKR
jgi:hypothetical protein